MVGYRENRVLIVNDKNRENLGGLRLTRIRTDLVMVARQFRPVLAGAVCFFRPVVDPTADLSLEDAHLAGEAAGMGDHLLGDGRVVERGVPGRLEGDEACFEMVVAGAYTADGNDIAVMMVEAGGSEKCFTYYDEGAPKVDEEPSATILIGSPLARSRTVRGSG